MLRRGGLIVLLAGLGLLSAAPAHAGVYSVYACHLPTGAATGTDGWTPTAITDTPGDAEARDECRGGSGAMALRIAPASGGALSGTGSTWTFGIPADVSIQAASVDHTFSTAGPNHVGWELTDETGNRESCVFAGGGCAGAAGSVRFSPWAGRNVYFALVCRPPADTRCDGPAATALVARAVVELRDDLPPVPGAPSGALVDGSRAIVGRAEASVPVSDRGSGVSTLGAEVDGKLLPSVPVDANGGRCRAPFSFVVPCKLSATGTVAVDTTTLADGPHSVRLVIRDASGNQTLLGPYDVTVRNTPVACAPGINGAITAGLPKRRSATQKRAKAVRIRGTAPGGAQLRLISRVSRRGDGAKAVGATITAGADGRYSLPVPNGPSRSLRVGWRRAGEPDFACSRSLSLRVRSRISLSAPRSIPASLPRATFRGRLQGGYVPRKGKLVLLQGRQPGRSWRTFRAVHTNRKGRFSTRYRFSGARGTFRVRARVPGEAVYPFTPAGSRVVRVRVR